MRVKDIHIDHVYAVKVSGRVVPVRIWGESGYGGWHGTNLVTRVDIRVKSAQRCRYEMIEDSPGHWAPKAPLQR